MDSTPTRKEREPVLVVLHSDNYVEVFGESGTRVRIVRVPESFNDEMAIVAEDWVEQSLPRFWRKLYWPGKLLASAMNRPLLPSKMSEALGVRDLIKLLNKSVVENLPPQNQGAA